MVFFLFYFLVVASRGWFDEKSIAKGDRFEEATRNVAWGSLNYSTGEARKMF